MKIIFLSPVQKDARIERRINNIVNELSGAEFKLLYYRRDYYGEGTHKVENESLGEINHGKYIIRFFKILKNIPKIRREANTTNVFYVFSMDLLLLLILSTFNKRKFKLIYEIADLGGRTSSNLQSKTINFIENILLKYVDILVLTSKEYLKHFEALKNHDRSKNFILENKIDPKKYIQNSNDKSFNENKIVIGYFGLIRSKKSLDMLIELANQRENKIHVFIAGKFLGTENYIEKIKGLNNIEYFGTYQSPSDLPNLYSSIDLSWVAHNHQNSQFARANRFYEACFYKKPMITQVGTADGNIVDEKNLGLSIDMNNMEDSVDQILNIDTISFDKWKRNLKNLPPSAYSYTDEHNRLIGLIQN
ncbi:glycosyltransferase [Psychroflexus sp. CAK1W]|uniref:glycosyltransferase n=1 Tax=Psychroflexus curvus TaxID=2873595 RepID=UPI001CCE26D0|nr:glycosyltransferase [Psychroflexus curvus]MBZ9629081.1 glycosyltransferase [Psychroflexus curvus]